MSPGSATRSTAAPRLGMAAVRQFLQAQLALRGADGRLRNGLHRRRIILLRSQPVWDGTPRLAFGPPENRGLADVVVAPSPLAVYELVLRRAAAGGADAAAGDGGPAHLVILTDTDESELGDDLLARVYRCRVNVVESWKVVQDAFGAVDIDPSLRTEPWVIDALLDAAPPQGWPKQPGQTLSRRFALTQLFQRRLGVAGLDIDSLLTWTLTAGGPERYLALGDAERRAVDQFLAEEEQAGSAGRVLTALVAGGHGPDALAFGLVAAALWAHAEEPEDAQTHRALGRAEQYLYGLAGADAAVPRGSGLDDYAAAFGEAAERYYAGLLRTVRERPISGDERNAEWARRLRRPVLDRAAELIEHFGAQSAAAASPVLPEGLNRRLRAFAEALNRADPAAIAAAQEQLNGHQLSGQDEYAPRLHRAHMAARLARWLRRFDAPAQPADERPRMTVAVGIERHIAETGWVDRALEYVEAGGDPMPELSATYDALCHRVREQRRAIDREFAQALAAWTASAGTTGGMLAVENFLERIVAPVVRANERRVLLVVVDGMSAAIATGLAEQLRESWAEFDPLPEGALPDGAASGRPRRRAMAAALPTITAVSRTSLFAGRLVSGSQSTEKSLFPKHRFWGKSEVAVFHKDDLRSGEGGEVFGPELAAAISSERVHVAVVLNTVDDRLAKESRDGMPEWRLDELGVLTSLLRYAADQGRAVIITSDHGHVLERRSDRIPAQRPLSARHRTPGAAVSEQEVALAGPRVLAPESNDTIVALWDAGSRYTDRKAGYHGGAALAEFAIPVLAFLPFNAIPPKGWRELGDPRPTWWTGQGELDEASEEPGAVAVEGTGLRSPEATAAPQRNAAARQKQRRPAQNPDQQALIEFEDAAAAPVEKPASPASAAPDVPESTPSAAPRRRLVAELMWTDLFRSQLETLARRPNEPQVAAALEELLEANGTLPTTALAQRIGLPARRADGFAAVLRQLLNYDGVQVLETLPDGRTLRLDIGLLREQFGLGPAVR